MEGNLIGCSRCFETDRYIILFIFLGRPIVYSLGQTLYLDKMNEKEVRFVFGSFVQIVETLSRIF